MNHGNERIINGWALNPYEVTSSIQRYKKKFFSPSSISFPAIPRQQAERQEKSLYIYV